MLVQSIEVTRIVHTATNQITYEAFSIVCVLFGLRYFVSNSTYTGVHSASLRSASVRRSFAKLISEEDVGETRPNRIGQLTFFFPIFCLSFYLRSNFACFDRYMNVTGQIEVETTHARTTNVRNTCFSGHSLLYFACHRNGVRSIFHRKIFVNPSTVPFEFEFPMDNSQTRNVYLHIQCSNWIDNSEEATDNDYV